MKLDDCFYSWVEFVYRIGFHIISDVYVRFHRLVVAMSRPFHDHLCRNAERQGITDESPSSGLGAKQCVFGCNGINTPASFRGSPKGVVSVRFIMSPFFHKICWA